MKKRWITVLLLILAVLTFAPAGAGRYAVEAQASQTAAAGTWESKGGKWYYREASGYATGWRAIDGEWYYFNAGGEMQTGWLSEGGSWYYLAASGKMRTGWVSVDGSWYYMAASGKMQTGWVSVDGSWYYMAASGKMQTGWVKVGSSWYYMAASGKMQTGWVKVGSDWYYMASSGKMYTGWLNPSEYRVFEIDEYDYMTDEVNTTKVLGYKGNRWYYLKPSGKMATGWESLGGKWYYFSASGVMQTGWQKISGKWYYLWEYMDRTFYGYDSADEYCEWYSAGGELGVMTAELGSASAIYQKLIAMKSSYPEGMHYTNNDMYKWEMGNLSRAYSYGYGCAAFVAIMSDAAFGRVPVRFLKAGEWSYDSLRVGDILRVNGDTHSVIVLEKTSTGVVVAEANYNSSVHWGRKLSKETVLARTDYVLTRYPENYD